MRKTMIWIITAALTLVIAMAPVASTEGYTGQFEAFAAENNPVEQGYLEVDFENDNQPFGGRSGRSWSLTTEGRDSNHVLLISGRTDSWDGPDVDVTAWMKPYTEYTFSAFVKQKENQDERLNVSLELRKGDDVEYRNIGKNIVLPPNVWKKVTFNFIAPESGNDMVKMYMQSGNQSTFDFMIDNVSVRESTSVSQYAAGLNRPSLKDTYQDYFSIGIGQTPKDLNNEDCARLIRYHFNSMTFGNEMKPDYLLDQEASKASADGSPEIKYETLDDYLTLVQENDLKIRGHVLVWYSQTPDWLFKEGYESNGAYVDHATMSFRMEEYIRKTLQYIHTKFPGVVYAWDVVNEAADDLGGYRMLNNNWYTVMGESYVEEAFRYARKYAPSDVTLFYNDYNTYYPAKRDTIVEWLEDLRGKGLVDGMGMQSHIDLRQTATSDYLETLETFAGTGVEIHISELDIHNPDNGIAGQKKLADKYAAIFSGICQLKRSGKANVTNVTIWGLLDSETWLTENRNEMSYPLLFDGNGNPKEAFDAVIDVIIPNSREQYENKS